MQTASMHDGNGTRNSDFPEAFSSRDTRPVAEFLRGHLFPSFHFDVLQPKKAATATNDLQFFSIPEQTSRFRVLSQPLMQHSLQLAIQPAKLRINARPRRERPLPVKNLFRAPRP